MKAREIAEKHNTGGILQKEQLELDILRYFEEHVSMFLSELQRIKTENKELHERIRTSR